MIEALHLLWGWVNTIPGYIGTAIIACMGWAFRSLVSRSRNKRAELTAAHETIRQLRAEVEQLKEQIRQTSEKKTERAAMTFRHNAYWRRSGSSEEGPFCSSCFD